MALSISFTDHRLNGEEMELLLERKHQFWDELKTTGVLRAIGPHARFGAIFEEDKPLVYLFEMDGEPGNLSLLVIKETDRTDRRKEELQEIAQILHDRWFNLYKYLRVEARVPDGFVQTSRILRRMGFRQETGPAGLRGMVRRDGHPVNIHVFGLLPSDIEHKPSDKMISDGVTDAQLH